MTPEEVVQKQLEAYNQCDLEAFAATYSDDVKIVDGDDNVICEGIEKLRKIYAPLFKDNPHQMALITRRVTGGNWVCDDEEVIGRADNKRRHALAIYRVRNGRISFVRLVAK